MYSVSTPDLPVNDSLSYDACIERVSNLTEDCSVFDFSDVLEADVDEQMESNATRKYHQVKRRKVDSPPSRFLTSSLRFIEDDVFKTFCLSSCCKTLCCSKLLSDDNLRCRVLAARNKYHSIHSYGERRFFLSQVLVFHDEGELSWVFFVGYCIDNS